MYQYCPKSGSDGGTRLAYAQCTCTVSYTVEGRENEGMEEGGKKRERKKRN